MPSRFVHVIAYGRLSFFVKAEFYSIVCIRPIFQMHSSTHGHLFRLSPYLGYCNSVAVSVGVVSREMRLSHTCPQSALGATLDQDLTQQGPLNFFLKHENYPKLVADS